MGMVYFDLDGVLRDLSGATGRRPPRHWDETVNGVPFCDYIHSNLELLETAKPTEFLPVALRVSRLIILTCQFDDWKAGTRKWISKHIGRPGLMHVEFFKSPEDKLKFVMDQKPKCTLVEDYPFFDDYSRIALVRAPYNSNVTWAKNVIEHPRQLELLLERERMI